ncbi:MAG: selenocysteine-specific translation elongation factor [Anaerolineae bacterium]
MFVIGTAGHVDHGKSTLIEALTGIDPDRLAEEKAREMTIDLGFAWLRLDDEGEEVGVVDVPGHRDFIENMLAGVGGIDLALFVIAADEGVMPQTKEHLAILDLLEIPGGVVALTKVDLIDDPDWLELVTLEVSETLAGTALAEAPIVPVSAQTGAGLLELKSVLQEKLAALPERPSTGKPRLPIDRVFSLSGFGTIVTGTLAGGRFRVGDAVEIQPGGVNGRIRGLQTHQTKREIALPGSRVAINLTGVDRDEVARGQVVAAPGVVSHTILLDASYRHLADAPAPLQHNVEVKLFVGSAEVLARTRVIGAPQINPGETGWLQLALAQPTAVMRNDRFILRRPSPGATLGGGKILDPHPGRRRRRFREDVIAHFQTLAQGTPAEILNQELSRIEPAKAADLIKKSGLDADAAQSILAEMETQGNIIRLGQLLVTRARWEKWQDRMAAVLTAYHQESPLRPGIPREELRSRLQMKAAVFNPFIAQSVADNLLIDTGSVVHNLEFVVTFTPAQKTAVHQLQQRFARAGINSPSVKEAKAALGENVYFALVESGQLRQISNDVVYRPEEYEQVATAVTQYLQTHGQINAAQARDLLQTSRKYAIAILEHFDEIRVTRRVDDHRVLR